MPTLILAAVGGAVLLRYAFSWARLLAEISIVPGVSVSCSRVGVGSPDVLCMDHCSTLEMICMIYMISRGRK